MFCGKRILILSLVLLCVTYGCGRKAEESQIESISTIEEAQRLATVTPPGPVQEPAGGPITRIQPKMMEPEKKIILEEGEILISDFEGWPNNLGGEMGVYGALEPNWDNIATVPYSWVYEPITPGYDPANVHGGRQSFKLVNGLGLKPELTWGSFAMDLGPTVDLTVVPKKVESLDASGYRYLTFWVKGEKGGEKMQFLMRDAHALNYMPQIKHPLHDAATEWQKIVISLEEISNKVDLSQLDNIGIAFGKDVGNMLGEIIYIDDFIFTNTP